MTDCRRLFFHRKTVDCVRSSSRIILRAATYKIIPEFSIRWWLPVMSIRFNLAGMLVRPVASYGCLTCGFRCFSSQMIQLHWRHWHHGFVASSPCRSATREADGPSKNPTESTLSHQQTKHPPLPSGPIFKDKNLIDTNKTLTNVKHWAVSFIFYSISDTFDPMSLKKKYD